MGVNQSHSDSDDSDASETSESSESPESSESSESSDSYNSYDSADSSSYSDCTTVENTSYLENYPYPLGRFKSVHVIKNVSKVIENMDDKPTHHSKWFHKMNISFSHGISVVNPRTRLYFYVACKVKNTIGKFWKVKTNIVIKIRNFNNERDSEIRECGELCFSSRDSNMKALHGRTNFHLVDHLNEYVRNNEMIIEADIRVLEVEGFRQPLVINYRLPPENPENWLSFTQPDDTFYCNKAILCANLKPGGQYHLKFKQPSSRSFEELLDSVYGFPFPISNRISVRHLLKLSQSFKIGAVARKVETTVIHRSNMDNSYREIAVSFNLRRVIHAWLNKKQSIKKKDVEDLDVEKMSGEIMKAIVKKVFEVGWKRGDECEAEN